MDQQQKTVLTQTGWNNFLKKKLPGLKIIEIGMFSATVVNVKAGAVKIEIFIKYHFYE